MQSRPFRPKPRRPNPGAQYLSRSVSGAVTFHRVSVPDVCFCHRHERWRGHARKARYGILQGQITSWTVIERARYGLWQRRARYGLWQRLWQRQRAIWTMAETEHDMGYGRDRARYWLWQRQSTIWAMAETEHDMGYGRDRARYGLWQRQSTIWTMAETEHDMDYGRDRARYWLWQRQSTIWTMVETELGMDYGRDS